MFNHALLPGVINRNEDKYGALPQSKFWKLDGGYGPLKPFEQWPEHDRLKKALPALHKLLASADVLGGWRAARGGLRGRGGVSLARGCMAASSLRPVRTCPRCVRACPRCYC